MVNVAKPLEALRLGALRAANGDTTALAEPSDGEDKGYVTSGDGVTFRVGHRRKLDGTPDVYKRQGAFFR